MNLNPELRRNIWLELTPQRLLGAPILLAVFFFMAYLYNDKTLGEGVAYTAISLYCVFTILWGTKLAAEAIISEIKNHTWDGQRLSGLGPWSLALGKLAGSAIYPWYCALPCLAVYASCGIVINKQPPLNITIFLILTGLISQAAALFASLVAIRKNRIIHNSLASACFILGVMVGLKILASGLIGDDRLVWYGATYTFFNVSLLSTLIFLTWTTIGIHAMLRAELQISSGPWTWCAFIIFAIFYFAGFVDTLMQPAMAEIFAARYGVALYVAIGITYLSLLTSAKDPIAFRRLLRALQEGDIRKTTHHLPAWLVALIIALFTAALAIITGPAHNVANFIDHNYKIIIVAFCILLIRDTGLLLFLNLAKNPKRADALFILCLGLLYGLIPATLAVLDMTMLTSLFWPPFTTGQDTSLIILAVEAIVMIYLVIYRWRESMKGISDQV